MNRTFRGRWLRYQYLDAQLQKKMQPALRGAVLVWGEDLSLAEGLARAGATRQRVGLTS